MEKIISFLGVYIRAWANCAYLLIFGIFRSADRDELRRVSRCFVPPEEKPPLSVPEIPYHEAVGQSVCVVIRYPVVEKGNISLLETMALNAMVRKCSVRCFLEIGTFNGRTALNIAANMPEEGVVYTLDLPREGMDTTNLPLDPRDKILIDKEASGALFVGTPEERRIRQLFGDSATFDFSPYHGSVDMVFVDGSHSCEYAKKDTQTALKLLRSGGTVVWHDYGTFDGVTAALNNLYATDRRFSGMRRIAGTSLVHLPGEAS